LENWRAEKPKQGSFGHENPKQVPLGGENSNKLMRAGGLQRFKFSSKEVEGFDGGHVVYAVCGGLICQKSVPKTN
jgi:hypothetical protein